jgi:hypothetical protein
MRYFLGRTGASRGPLNQILAPGSRGRMSPCASYGPPLSASGPPRFACALPKSPCLAATQHAAYEQN